MTLDTHTPSPPAAPRDPETFKERLRDAHRGLGPDAICRSCGQASPCDTILLLDDHTWLLEGYGSLQRQIPMTYATLFQANAAAAAARTIILGRQRRRPFAS